MCDLAILVVDIMHGLEPQTLESLGLLRKGNTPFVVALNKIDRLFDWRRMPTSSVKEAVKKQNKNTKDEFDERVKGVVTEFAEQVWSQFSNFFFFLHEPKKFPFPIFLSIDARAPTFLPFLSFKNPIFVGA